MQAHLMVEKISEAIRRKGQSVRAPDAWAAPQVGSADELLKGNAGANKMRLVVNQIRPLAGLARTDLKLAGQFGKELG